MTINEFKKAIKNSENKDFFDECTVSINYSHINYKIELKGLVSIYNFIDKQVAGWTFDKIPNNLLNSKDHFKRIKSQILDLVNDHNNYSLENKWRQIKNSIEEKKINNVKIFIYDAPETHFLIKIFNEYPDYYNGVFKFITNEHTSIDRIESFIGYLMGYEFIFQGDSEIISRRSNEKPIISTIRNNFLKDVNNSTKQIDELIENTEKIIEEKNVEFSGMKESKENEFVEFIEKRKEQFTTLSEEFKQFHKDSIENIDKTNKLYSELLKLKAPAEYWCKRAIDLKKEGKNYLKWLYLLIIIGASSLYFLLWQIPDGIFLKIFKGEISAIKWSIIYITFLSLIAYGIRILAKLSFSTFHLVRDAEEREKLTYLYLALKNDSNVEDSDRQIILQSLFSRADTGLLKEDSAPTMPTNSILEKFSIK